MKSKKKYIVRFVYKDENSKTHQASVRFGEKSKKYYVDHHNIDERQHCMLKVKKVTPFNAAYWEMWFLNNCEDI